MDDIFIAIPPLLPRNFEAHFSQIYRFVFQKNDEPVSIDKKSEEIEVPKQAGVVNEEPKKQSEETVVEEQFVKKEEPKLKVNFKKKFHASLKNVSLRKVFSRTQKFG